MADSEQLRIGCNDGVDIRGATVELKVKASPFRATSFHVHETLLSGRSPLLDAVQRPSDPQHQIAVDKLKSIADTDFGRYICYLYTGKFATKTITGPTSYDAERISTNEEYKLLFDLHSLAQTLEDSQAQDAVIDAIIERYKQIHSDTKKHSLPWLCSIISVYNDSAAPSPLRRLLTDIYVREVHPGIMPLHSDLPAEFKMDLAKATLELNNLISKGKGDADHPIQIERCDYHSHANEAVCASRKRKRPQHEDVEELSLVPCVQVASPQTNDLPLIQLRCGDIGGEMHLGICRLRHFARKAPKTAITLPADVALETISGYFQWLYARTICSKASEAERTARRPASGYGHEEKEYVFLAKLYSFALRFEDAGFVNAVATAFEAKMEGETASRGAGGLPGWRCANLLMSNMPGQIEKYSELDRMVEAVVSKHAQEQTRNWDVLVEELRKWRQAGEDEAARTRG
ncbi:hypothetical protein LTR08_008235 [Meristemomyces frigidus]|nr:hypothetical protein LTR08_008235 [Meristemomyces frigidus]